ncbi:MAG: HlyD family type I secretion periplasmic adaptor subunit [Campylobacterota bacterium]|nr:HlyD family type I secretion periplasmic adaptor subunit [Campylobacterota bacterium]
MANSDLKFINSLYGIANETIKRKVDYLFFTIISLVLILIVWGNLAQIDELTRGEGKVIPSSKIQKVQYFDNGIVTAILKKEGDHVKKGEALMRIDITRFQASFEETQENILSLKVATIRLKKELSTDYQGSLPKLKFDKYMRDNAQEYISSQKNIFKNKFYERRNSLKVTKLQYKQKKQELVEIRSKYSQLKKSLQLVKKQYTTIKRLTKSGSKSKIELLDKEKELNTLEGEIQSAKLSIPRSKFAIEELNAQIEEKLQSYKSEISVELQKITSEIKTVEARLVTDTDKLAKTVIESPVDGMIKQININTIGGVVQSGVDLIEIVPDSDILLVEAKIDPKDIAFIHPDLKALVKLTAYDFSIYGGLEASIVEISVDSIKDIDSKDGKSYYKIVVKTNQNYIEHRGEKLPIIPGMVASVDIVTGKKTIMDFILKPILKVKDGALHER